MVRRSWQSTTFSSTPYFSDQVHYGAATPISERMQPHSRPIVSYYYPHRVGEHHYGEHHPMKPHRLTLTNALIFGYDLGKRIDHIYNPRLATKEELEAYHDHDYVDFLSRVTPQNQSEMKAMLETYNCVEDCPIFTDMFDFCRKYAGASIAGARKLAAGTTDIAINWSGGLHHAKRGEASGFCYVNDIVLAILELLRYHPRVLYIDIDIHHGDGVELAFWESNRVMTVSFHKYTGDFFPGTGKLDDNGRGIGKYFSINVPLLDGIDDEMYVTTFKAVIGDVVAAFQPSSIVLQCGADSLGCDRLGAFNLSIAAHGECVDFVRAFDIPLLVLGGGGYTIKNVSRCWTYETAVLVGVSIPDELPVTAYDSFFEDSNWRLHPPLTGKVENRNTPASLQGIVSSVRSKLRYLQGAPSVALQEIPPDIQGFLADEGRTAEEKEEEHGTQAAGERRRDRHAALNEFFHSERDVDAEDALSIGETSANRRAKKPRVRRSTSSPPPPSPLPPLTVMTSKEDGDQAAASSGQPRHPRVRNKNKSRSNRTKKAETEKTREIFDIENTREVGETRMVSGEVEQTRDEDQAETTGDSNVMMGQRQESPNLDVHWDLDMDLDEPGDSGDDIDCRLH